MNYRVSCEPGKKKKHASNNALIVEPSSCHCYSSLSIHGGIITEISKEPTSRKNSFPEHQESAKREALDPV